MRHTERWYDELAKRLGHPGYLTLDEIRRAESDKRRPKPVAPGK